MTPQLATLYAVPHSLSAGRARSYLIKAGIAYREQAPKSKHYLEQVLPQAGGRFGMPTLELQDELAPGTVCARGLGQAEFDLGGTKISALAQPYRFYLLKRAQDEFAAMGADDRRATDAIMEASGMAPVLGTTLTREIGRQNNLEVWL